MSKTRHIFTLDNDTAEILKEQKNKSNFVETSVKFYNANKDVKIKREHPKPTIEVIHG